MFKPLSQRSASTLRNTSIHIDTHTHHPIIMHSKGQYLTPREKLYKHARACAHRDQVHFGAAINSFPSTTNNWEIDRVYAGNVSYISNDIFETSELMDEKQVAWSSKPVRARLPLGKEGDVYLNKRRDTIFSKDICLSDGSEDFNESEFYESLNAAPSRSNKPVTFSLTDIPIRVTKPRGKQNKNWSHETSSLPTNSVLGIKKEYEVVDQVQRVIALDDDFPHDFESGDEWEDIYASEWVTAPVADGDLRPYSSVVRTGRG